MSVHHRHRTALVIPVPELGAITLIDPFLPEPEVDGGVLTELEDFFGSLVSFAFALGEPTRFPDGARYLPLEPSAPFRRIVAGLRTAFPEAVPRAGRASMTPPMLPWPESPTAIAPKSAAPSSPAPSPPAGAVAREAQLLAGAELETVLATFEFGTTAA